MNARHALTALGAGLTTVLLVTVLVIELLAFEFSALVGLPVGILAGLAILTAVAVAYEDFDRLERRTMSAFAAFGLTVVGLAALNYVNLAGDGLSGTIVAAVGLTVSVLTFLGLWAQER
ncbi:hypothetical protein [Salinibaculum rarum]|jgi:riboflavin transporter FmnP|uniref:hypothetical protein n=1 Tax=Salinibaculum rarum TaxID=3058903 RepID=UPI00265DF2D7|nr:hypothetical protein [Salinibaculum sp. KK48]